MSAFDLGAVVAAVGKLIHEANDLGRGIESIEIKPGAHPVQRWIVSMTTRYDGGTGSQSIWIPGPCEMCGGSGQAPLGEHFVTRDMAIDAGDRAMEGMSMGIEYGKCPACSGSGEAEASAHTEKGGSDGA